MIQEAGDCIFIPYAMLHQVEKFDEGLQVAASWMFLPETIYDEKACSQAPLTEDLPLAVMDTLFMYTGKGIIPQGYNDPLYFVRGLEEGMRKRRLRHLTESFLAEELSKDDAILATVPDRKRRIQAMHRLLSSYAEDPAKGLAVRELSRVPLRVWCKPAAEGDGPLPCDVGEEYHFCDDDEFPRIEEAVQRQLARQAEAGAALGSEAPEPSAAPPRVWAPRVVASRRQEL